jgi:hypothetical protein
MKAIAIRKGQDRQKGPQKYHRIATVKCDRCGAEFVISHQRKLKRSRSIAAEQAAELRTILTEDHRPKGKREHPDLVEFE